MDRWIAAQPWESRVSVHSSPKKPFSQQTSKTGKNINSPKPTKTPTPVKSNSPNGKGASVKPRKLSFEATERVIPQKGSKKAEDTGAKKTLSNNC